eukprot:4211831-Pleurochrysis_carterae.AAC.2
MSTSPSLHIRRAIHVDGDTGAVRRRNVMRRGRETFRLRASFSKAVQGTVQTRVPGSGQAHGKDMKADSLTAKKDDSSKA